MSPAALAGTTASAGIFPQCPEGATPAPISNPGMIDTTTIAQADAKVCAHLAAGDGWALKADGGRHYAFGFSNMTDVANDQVVLKGLFNAKWSAPTMAFREGEEV